MKKILVTQYFVRSFELKNRPRGIDGQNMYMLSEDYVNALNASGYITFIVPMTKDKKVLEDVIKSVDGVLLTGGEDVSPILYGEPVTSKEGIVSPQRDEFELRIIEMAEKRNLPILGICRGLQILTVYYGGKLIQDLEAISKLKHWAFRGERAMPVHRVEIKKESILYELYREENLFVNSFHRQAILDVPKMFKISAVSEDGVIEAIESKEKKILGVQWHPEMMIHLHKQHLKVFKFFEI